MERREFINCLNVMADREGPSDVEDIVKWKNIGETMWIVIMCVMAPFFVTLLLVTGNLVVEFMDPYVQLSLSLYLSINLSLSIYPSLEHDDPFSNAMVLKHNDLSFSFRRFFWLFVPLFCCPCWMMVTLTIFSHDILEIATE